MEVMQLLTSIAKQDGGGTARVMTRRADASVKEACLRLQKSLAFIPAEIQRAQAQPRTAAMQTIATYQDAATIPRNSITLRLNRMGRLMSITLAAAMDLLYANTGKEIWYALAQNLTVAMPITATCLIVGTILKSSSMIQQKATMLAGLRNQAPATLIAQGTASAIQHALVQ